MENNAETAKAFELRNLTADDMFPMFQIISKIGVKEFKNCFSSPETKDAIAAARANKGNEEVPSLPMVDEAETDNLNAVGVSIALDIASVILANIGNCKNDIYQLLSQLSGMPVKEVAQLPMLTFTEMVIAVIKKEEFKDFFKAAARLFK